MNFLADENFPLVSSELLKSNGHSLRLASVEFTGQPDTKILKEAIEKEEIILTFDKDFGELIFRNNFTPPPGIIPFRLQTFTPDFPGLTVLKLLLEKSFSFTGNFTVINNDKTRQKRFAAY